MTPHEKAAEWDRLMDWMHLEPEDQNAGHIIGLIQHADREINAANAKLREVVTCAERSLDALRRVGT